MRYRIVITTYENGKTRYLPQVRKGIKWKNIGSGHCRRQDFLGFDITNYEVDSRDEALGEIDRHYKDVLNNKIKSIEFEYINKP